VPLICYSATLAAVGMPRDKHTESFFLILAVDLISADA